MIDEINEAISGLYSIKNEQARLLIVKSLIELCKNKLIKIEQLSLYDSGSVSQKEFYKKSLDYYVNEQRLVELSIESFARKIRNSLNTTLTTPVNLVRVGQLAPASEILDHQLLLKRALINQPQIKIIDCQIKQAAAQRDMGHPLFRKDYLTLQLNYGLGVYQYEEVVDDFLSLTTGVVIPLQTKELQLNYDRKWTYTIESLRHEKEAARQEVMTQMNNYYDKVTSLTSYLSNQRETELLLYEQMRKTKTVEDMGLAIKLPGADIDRSWFNYLEGKLRVLRINQERTDVCLNLLKEASDIELYKELVSTDDILTQTRSFYTISKDIIDNVTDIKKIVEPMPLRSTVVLEINDFFQGGLSAEILYIYKYLRLRKIRIVPVLNGDSKTFADDAKRFILFSKKYKLDVARVLIRYSSLELYKNRQANVQKLLGEYELLVSIYKDGSGIAFRADSFPKNIKTFYVVGGDNSYLKVSHLKEIEYFFIAL